MYKNYSFPWINFFYWQQQKKNRFLTKLTLQVSSTPSYLLHNNKKTFTDSYKREEAKRNVGIHK